MDISRKSAVITGANRGIGKAIAGKMAENGYNVFACARQKTSEFEQYLLNLAKLYRVDVVPVYFDLADESQVKAGAKEILTTKKEISVIVNNAGIVGVNRLFSMTKIEEIKDVFQVNFFSPMLLTQMLLKNMMRNKKGNIINIASIAAIEGEPAQFEYVSSKAAIIGATKKLASELASFNIRVNAVAPGVIETDMVQDMEESLLSKTVDKTALKRMGKAEEIAKTVMFLASEASSYITGQIVRVDGGM